MGCNLMEVGEMPKENVRDCVIESFRVELSWRSASPDLDGHVQLATVNSASPFEFAEKNSDNAFEAGEKFDGWHATLDRDGINRLIRQLRRARDAAYGTDA
jgi:hypothetical protein